MLNKWIIKLTEWKIHWFYIGNTKHDVFPVFSSLFVSIQLKLPDWSTWELEVSNDSWLKRIKSKMVNWFLHYI